MSEFTYITIQSTWGVRATIEAVWQYVNGYDESAIKVSEKLSFVNESKYLTKNERDFIHFGFELIASEIDEAFKDKESILVIIKDILYNPCDYQDEGLACAVIGWVSQEFGITAPTVDVSFNKKRNKYIFRFPDNYSETSN